MNKEHHLKILNTLNDKVQLAYPSKDDNYWNLPRIWVVFTKTGNFMGSYIFL